MVERAEKIVGLDGKPFEPEVIKGNKKEQKLTKDGRIKQTPNNSKKNREYVMPFKEEDITKMIEWLNMRIMCSGNDEDREIAVRNKFLFIMGCNTGLRVSDLQSLTWNDVFDEKGNLRESKVIKPWKTRNINKHIDQEFNETFRMSVVSYIKENLISVNIDKIKESISLEKKLAVKNSTLDTMKKSIKKIDKYTKEEIEVLESEIDVLEKQYKNLAEKLYVFPSREGGHIQDGIIRKMIVDGSAACGIKYNTSTHSMRKTYARQRYETAEDKTDELIQLMNAFGHTSESITLKYIGVMKEKNKQSANRISVGLTVSEEDIEMLENFKL